MTPPHPHWHDLHDLHRWLAEIDAPDPAPHVVGHAGDDTLVAIWLRPFARGAHQGPLVEALALALPMGCDRVSVGMPARAWSLDDPVVPVTPEGDLRQRVLLTVTVDGHRHRPPRLTTRLHPFDVIDDRLCWQPPVDPGPGEGWMADALVTLVGARDDLRPADSWELTDQAERLHALGHTVCLTDAGCRALLA